MSELLPSGPAPNRQSFLVLARGTPWPPGCATGPVITYLATATRHGIGWLDALTRAAEGSPWIPETG